MVLEYLLALVCGAGRRGEGRKGDCNLECVGCCSVCVYRAGCGEKFGV